MLSDGLRIDELANRTNSTSAGLSVVQKAFNGAGNLFRSPTGPRIAAPSIEGWDTHSSQVTTFNTRLNELGDGLNQFKTAIGDAAWGKIVTACVTEFARTVAPNGTAGTDHGTGTVSLLAGGALNGAGLH